MDNSRIIRAIREDLREAAALERMAATLRARCAAKAQVWDLTIEGDKVLTAVPIDEKMPETERKEDP